MVNETTYEPVDMETSAVVQKFIATNIPAADLLVERHFPKDLLLPPGYEQSIFSHLDLSNHQQQVDKQKLIVQEDCIIHLLEVCRTEGCGAKTSILNKVEVGAVVTYQLICKNSHWFEWSTSSSIRGMFTTNLLLCSSLLFSGNNFQKIYRMFNFLNLKFISDRYFQLVQRKYLFPSIDDYYIRSQDIILGNLAKTDHIILAGDGQMDSPGLFASCERHYCFSDIEIDWLLGFFKGRNQSISRLLTQSVVFTMYCFSHDICFLENNCLSCLPICLYWSSLSQLLIFFE